VLVESRYLVIHGGLPIGAQTLEDLANAHLTHPKQSFLEDMLWSDPNGDEEDYVASPRGAGKLFSRKTTTKMLDKFNVHLLIRGHEPCEEGFKIDHEGKILTLFSRKGTPYFNTHGAYLILDLSKEFKNASELIPFIHKF
jgi:protein phosphatase